MSDYISIEDANGNIVSVKTEELRNAYFKELQDGGMILGLGLKEISGLLKLYQSLCGTMPITEENIRKLIKEDTATKPTFGIGIPFE